MRAVDRLVDPSPGPPDIAPAPASPAGGEAETEPDADPYIHQGGACRTWVGMSRVCVAEALGTALLVLLAPSPGPLAPLQAGLAVAAVIQCLGCVSGAQVNPCVSVCAWWTVRMRGARLVGELAAQLTGALAGAALHHLLAPDVSLLTTVAPGYPTYKAVCVEASCTLFLALGNLSQWRAGRADTWPLRAAALVAALSGFAGSRTGGSMNPARSFGPALLSGHWERHWVYWVGPLSGSVLACVLQRLLFPSPRPAPPPGPRKPSAEP